MSSRRPGVSRRSRRPGTRRCPRPSECASRLCRDRAAEGRAAEALSAARRRSRAGARHRGAVSSPRGSSSPSRPRSCSVTVEGRGRARRVRDVAATDRTQYTRRTRDASVRVWPRAGCDGDRAAGFRAATASFRELGVPFWLGVTLLEHAEWLVDEGNPEKPATAGRGTGDLRASQGQAVARAPRSCAVQGQQLPSSLARRPVLHARAVAESVLRVPTRASASSPSWRCPWTACYGSTSASRTCRHPHSSRMRPRRRSRTGTPTTRRTRACRRFARRSPVSTARLHERRARSRTEIVITASGVQALHLAIRSQIDPGDEALVLTPAWPNGAAIVGSRTGADEIPPLAGERYDVDSRRSRRRSRRARGSSLYTSPSNPLGWVATTRSRTRLLDFAAGTTSGSSRTRSTSGSTTERAEPGGAVPSILRKATATTPSSSSAASRRPTA